MTSSSAGRTCSRTGLRLVAAQKERTYRVAKETWGPLSAPGRRSSDPPHERNRYDTVGTTLYMASTREAAFAEVLASYKRVLGSADPLEADASALGISLEELVEEIAEQWGERHFMATGHLPAVWREARAVYTLATPERGWWVDIEHPDSIASLSDHLEHDLAAAGVTTLTTAVLRSEARTVTTKAAQWIRSQVLDDGSEPLGIAFGSKHGGGGCWAYWLRRADAGLGLDHLEQLAAEPITSTSDPFKRTCRRFKIVTH